MNASVALFGWGFVVLGFGVLWMEVLWFWILVLETWGLEVLRFSGFAVLRIRGVHVLGL